jgi:hypothetical protein
MKRLFPAKREEVTADFRKLHNEEKHNLHVSLYIIRIIKLMITKRAGYLANMKELRYS